MKKLTFFIALAAFFTMLISFQSCQSSSKVSSAKLLKFNLEKGKGYDYEMVWDMSTKAGGQETKISIDCLYSMNVTANDGSVKTVTSAYKAVKMNIDAMGMNIDIDSDKPVKDNGTPGEKDPLGAMNKVFSSMVGKPFVIKVDEEGKVLEVIGFDKIVSDMVDSIGGDESTKAQVMASMKDQFNEQSIKDNFAQMFTIFPNKEVKVGDTWDKTHSTGGKMPAKFNTTYTVKEIEGDHVTLAAKTKIGSSGEGDMQIDGTQTGNIIVDSKTGLMVNAEYDQDMQVKTKGVSITVTGKGKIKGKAN